MPNIPLEALGRREASRRCAPSSSGLWRPWGCTSPRARPCGKPTGNLRMPSWKQHRWACSPGLPSQKKSCGAAPGVTWSCLLPVVSQLFLPDPVLQENHSVGLADQVVDLYFSKILKSSQIQVQSLALLLTELPRTALNWDVSLLNNVLWLFLCWVNQV